MHKRLIAILLLTIFLVACSPEQKLDKIIAETTYDTYKENGFSIEYPDWPTTDNRDAKVEISVSQGFCSIVVNQESMSAKQWYDAMLQASEDNEDIKLEITDSTNNRIKHSMPYKEFTMVSDTTIYDCNEKATSVSTVCISEAVDKAQAIRTHILNSAKCEEEETHYNTLKDSDYTIKYPDWDNLEEESPETRVLAQTKGVCSLIVDKHNALPKDINSWIKKSIDDNNEKDLIKTIETDNSYSIEFKHPYEKYTVTSEIKIFYCNYMSYLTNVMCVNELVTDEYEEIKQEILDSAICLKEYEIPTPKVIEKKKEIVEEEDPEVIEEIKEEIVQTNIGEEFGIDEHMVVYFINSNQFFTKIMKDFPKVNLVFEDKDNNRNLELKVTIDDEGKITELIDGQHSNPTVKMSLPLRDAINLFSNAANINPLNLVSFAINVKTDPVHIKNEVIQNVLKGKYN